MVTAPKFKVGQKVVIRNLSEFRIAYEKFVDYKNKKGIGIDLESCEHYGKKAEIIKILTSNVTDYNYYELRIEPGNLITL